METDTSRLEIPDPPDGFAVEPIAEGVRVTYRTRGMGCMIVFMTVLLTWFPVGLTFMYLDAKRRGVAIPLPAPGDLLKMHLLPLACLAAGLSAYIYFTHRLLWMRYGQTEIDITSNQLTVRKVLFRFHRTRSVVARDIEKVVQVKDGGEGEDSFPSWGLDVHSRRRVNVLFRQPIDKSDWLGPCLARVYGVPFDACASRDDQSD